MYREEIEEKGRINKTKRNFHKSKTFIISSMNRTEGDPLCILILYKNEKTKGRKGWELNVKKRRSRRSSR